MDLDMRMYFANLSGHLKSTRICLSMNISKNRRVVILAYVNLGLFVFNSLFEIGIPIFDYYNNKNEIGDLKSAEVRNIIIDGIIGFIVTLTIEAALVNLLFNAIKKLSHRNCLIWIIVKAIILGNFTLISLILASTLSWLAIILTLVEFIYNICALKIVYDFMIDIKAPSSDGTDIPFQEIRKEDENA